MPDTEWFLLYLSVRSSAPCISILSINLSLSTIVMYPVINGFSIFSNTEISTKIEDMSTVIDVLVDANTAESI